MKSHIRHAQLLFFITIRICQKINSIVVLIVAGVVLLQNLEVIMKNTNTKSGNILVQHNVNPEMFNDRFILTEQC